ncbi:kinase-like domain-containing protein [Pilobolus umbonatus]|nr:kinase-like domain-containing protein [Pilobolus umbonatus]
MLRRQSENNNIWRDRISLQLPRHPIIMTNTVHKDYDPNTGNKLINHYMIIKEIGRGVHGKVKLAENMDTGELVAIKIVDKKNRRQMGYSLLRGNNQYQAESLSKENEQKIKREIAILKKCTHPNVIQLREVIDDPSSRKIYMALEYTEIGEIEWRDQNEQPIMTVDEARRYFRDIVSGLDYLHYQGIIHRDIKPANLLLDHNHVVKISDFGVSYYNELLAEDNSGIQATDDMINRIDRELAETAGTPAFFAPELCCAGDMPATQSTQHPRKPRITKAIDVWALGVTLYCFIFGRCPFIASTEFELFDTIPTQPLTFPSEEGLDDSLKDLLQQLLTKNPEDRITLDRVKHHPWVTADLTNPAIWIAHSDPRKYIAAYTNQAEPHEPVTFLDRLRRSIQKLTLSFGGKRKSRMNVNEKHLPDRPTSYHPTSQSTQYTLTTIHHNNTNNQHPHPHPNANYISNSNSHSNSSIKLHRHSQPAMNKQPSYSTSLLPHATSSVKPTVSVSTGHTLIFNSGLSSSIIPTPPLRPISSYHSDSITEDPEDYHPSTEFGSTDSTLSNYKRRPSYASSSSGGGLTFGKHRGNGMTPLNTANQS